MYLMQYCDIFLFVEKCSELLRSKDKMIDYLKNELKSKDENFVRELEKQGIEIDILIDRIEEQISVLKNAYTLQLEKLQVCSIFIFLF